MICDPVGTIEKFIKKLCYFAPNGWFFLDRGNGALLYEKQRHLSRIFRC